MDVWRKEKNVHISQGEKREKEINHFLYYVLDIFIFEILSNFIREILCYKIIKCSNEREKFFG